MHSMRKRIYVPEENTWKQVRLKMHYDLPYNSAIQTANLIIYVDLQLIAN